MTRFSYDQFAKSCFEPLLSTIGAFEPAKKVSAEVREMDIYFEPFPDVTPPADLGLLQQCVSTSMATVFEPFRNSAAPYEIRACASKLYELHNDIARKAKRQKQHLPLPNAWPFLWIVTPTLSRAVLAEFGAVQQSGWPDGVYFCPPGWKTGFIVVHQLPVIPKTLWFRLLGRNTVQARAIAELQALPLEHPYRRPLVESLANLKVILEARKPRQPYEQELFRLGRGEVLSFRPSQLDPDVRLSPHPAPDVLGFCLAHVFIIVAAFMNGF
jgi:hypothetical protein